MKLNYLIKSTFAFSVLSFVQPSINFILLPIFIKELTIEEFGVFSLMNNISNIVNVISGLGISVSISNFFYKYYHSKTRLNEFLKNIFSFIFYINLCIFLISIITGEFVFSQIFSNTEIKFFPLGVISVLIPLFGIFQTSFLLVLRNKKDLKRFFIISLVGFGLNAFFQMYFLIFLEMKVEGLLLGKLISNIVVSFFIFFQFNFLKSFISNKYLLPALGYSLKLLPFKVLIVILSYFDRFVVERYISLSELGKYSLIITISSIIQLSYIAIGNAFQPILFEIYEKKDNKKVNILKSKYFMLLISLWSIYLIMVCILKIIWPFEIDINFNHLLIYSLGVILTGIDYVFNFQIIYARKSLYLGSVNLFPYLIFIILIILFIDMNLFGIIYAFTLSRIISIPFSFFVSEYATPNFSTNKSMLVKYLIGIAILTGFSFFIL